jgi:hypothetical protein
MNTQLDLCNFVILAVLTCLVIRFLFKNNSICNTRTSYRSKPMAYEPFKMDLNDEYELLTKPDGSGQSYHGNSNISPTTKQKSCSKPDPSKSCPVTSNDKQVEIYTFGKLLGSDRLSNCASPNESSDSALDNHINFRNGVYQDSHLEDTVDRVSRLYLEGSSSVARGHRGKAIGDMFDDLTKGPTLYDRTCLRVPDFDSKLNSNFYDYNGNSGFELNQN